MIYFTSKTYYRSSHQWCSMKKGVLRNLTKFAGKHLCQSLFLQADCFRYQRTLIVKSIVKFSGRTTSGFILRAKSKFYQQIKSRIYFTGRITAGFILPAKSKFYWQNNSRIYFIGRIRVGFILPVEKEQDIYYQQNLSVTGRIRAAFILPVE